jgi:pimeloyl-ACP methyl ester carboxylesterase
MTSGESPDVEYLTVHGHRRAFVKTGSGPAVLLLHGLGCDHTTWDPVITSLARRYTVLAPDLLGHGASDKPRADYSVGGYANGMRDLLALLDIDRVTVVGHSLGGGVAMQFAYQYPELTERLVLVASGGFGPDVTAVIRLVALPGFHQVTGVLTRPGLRHLGLAGLAALARSGLPRTRDLGEVATIFDSLKDVRTRAAIAHVVRAVVDWRGQIITMSDRAYLTDDVPMCVIWGDDDQVIPSSHADVAGVVAPHSKVVIVPNSGHFPHHDHPHRFVKILHDFIRSTSPARFEREQWRGHLLRGGEVRVRQAEAGHAPVAPLGRIRPASSA